MRLSELFDETGMNPQAANALEIKGLTADSRAVKPGYLFAALPGATVDGRAFIAEAVSRGAVAVLAPPGTDVAVAVPVITDSNPRRRFALMAARYFHAQPETVAAVTGTNGKTSVATFTQQLWTTLGHNAGYLGTLGAWAPGLQRSGSLTTPDPVAIHELLADMAKGGTTHLAMETSSHGLHQFRTDGVKIAIGAFTNLTRDHLDYHGSMAAYMAAKLRLFSDVMIAGSTAVLNADNSEYPAFEAACKMRDHRILSFGKAGTALTLADLRVEGDAQHLSLIVLGKRYDVRLPLAGAFQASNALCALGCVIGSGADADRAVAALETLRGVPGRMEQVGSSKTGAPVYVDYAHTPDALETVLVALRPHVGHGGRLAIVFGCGGDRDKGKRRLMGERAQSLADLVFVTDDNPRTENAAEIRTQVMQGSPRATEIADRADAIATAIASLKAGDVLLIAGKGHETGQIVGGTVLPFNDADVARDALKVPS